MSDFKIYGALFKQDETENRKRLGDKFDASKNYPQYSGNLDINANDAVALADYLTSATPDKNGKIRIPLASWVKEAKTGRKYLSLQASPPRTAAPAAAASAAKPADDFDEIPF